jgi:hypothetical protein
MKRLIFLASALLAVLACGATAASTATTTAIGQTNAEAGYACNGEYDLQTGVASGTSFVVPAGTWIVTSWSTHAGAGGGSMSSMFFRPASAGSYTVVGASQVESLVPSVLNTFPVNIQVQGGDVLGFWATGGAACSTSTGQGTDVSPAGFGPQPAVDTTVTPATFPGFRSNVSATLTSALPIAIGDCKQGGWEDYSMFKNQGDCVSFVDSGGDNPPAGG